MNDKEIREVMVFKVSKLIVYYAPEIMQENAEEIAKQIVDGDFNWAIEG